MSYMMSFNWIEVTEAHNFCQQYELWSLEQCIQILKDDIFPEYHRPRELCFSQLNLLRGKKKKQQRSFKKSPENRLHPASHLGWIHHARVCLSAQLDPATTVERQHSLESGNPNGDIMGLVTITWWNKIWPPRDEHLKLLREGCLCVSSHPCISARAGFLILPRMICFIFLTLGVNPMGIPIHHYIPGIDKQKCHWHPKKLSDFNGAQKDRHQFHSIFRCHILGSLE